MEHNKIIVANLKCNGCETTIKKELLKLVGISKVDVDIESDIVEVFYSDIAREKIIQKLHSLGYPEATEKNGLLNQLKSYTSCMVGKINNL